MKHKEGERSEGERVISEAIGSALILYGVAHIAKSLHRSGHPNLARTVDTTVIAMRANHARRFLTPKRK